MEEPSGVYSSMFSSISIFPGDFDEGKQRLGINGYGTRESMQYMCIARKLHLAPSSIISAERPAVHIVTSLQKSADLRCFGGVEWVDFSSSSIHFYKFRSNVQVTQM